MRRRSALVLVALLALALAPTSIARVHRGAPKAKASRPTRLWYRAVFYGASEFLRSSVTSASDPVLAQFAGTYWEHFKIIFSGRSDHAVTLTQDPDGTVHTMASLRGSFSHYEHDWTVFDMSCFGGDATQTPASPGVLEGNLTISLPRRLSSSLLIPSFGTLTSRTGVSLDELDDYTATPVYCLRGGMALKETAGVSETLTNGMGLFGCGPQPTHYSIVGQVRFGSTFSIRALCRFHVRDSADQQVTSSEDFGIYFQLCPRGGRAGDPCPPRPVRHPWPPQSPLS
jgi:hypothetical protein